MEWSRVRSFAFFILVLAGTCSAQENPLVLTESDQSIDISSFTSYLRDPGNQLSLADAQGLTFAPLPEQEIAFGFTTDKIWLRTDILNATDQALERIVRTSARFMRPLEIYLVRESGSIEQLLYNDETLVFSDRPFPQLRFLSADFELEPGESAILYTKFGAGGQAAMTVQIDTLDNAIAEQFRASVITSIYITVLITLILVNLFHFAAVRKSAYLVYGFYESFNALYVSHMDGFTFQYLWPILPQWNDDATPVIASLGLIVGNFFALVYLDIRSHSTRLYQLFILVIALSAVALLATFVVSSRLGNQISAALFPISFLLSLVAASVALKAGNHLARYFLVAWSIFGLVAAIWSGSILGILNVNFDLLTVYKLVVAIQALIFSMGLADQVRRLNEEYISTQTALIKNLEGRLNDAKERMQLEKENEQQMLRLLEQSKQLATTSHDINQPIQSLRLSMQALKLKSGNNQHIEQLQKTLDHVESVLSATLDTASSEYEDTRSQTARCSIVAGKLTTDIALQFRDQAAAKGLELHAFNSVAVFVGYELQLRRCLGNLVSNAIDHTSEGKILVGVRHKDQRLEFQVLDSGPGIQAEEIERLQEPLEKGINSSGKGLGLAIVREICSEYGWVFNIRSAPGRGSCFSISVPTRA